jgi:hypothetical protein
MLAAQMQKSADKAMAAVSVVITAARPVAVVGKMLEHQSCTACAIWVSAIGLSAPDSGNERTVSPDAAIRSATYYGKFERTASSWKRSISRK